MGKAGRRIEGPRCVAIVGPFGSGKTTLLEALLTRTGAINKFGTVDGGGSIGDASDEARSHHMSVEANIAETEFLGDQYTFIDCPGSVEFQFESYPALSAADLAIVVCEPDEKKIPALQVILKSLEERNIPRILFLNKMDKCASRVREVVEALQQASTPPLLLRQIPIWRGEQAIGYIDLALERAFSYKDHAPSELVDMSEGDQEREWEARYSMLETLSDHDEKLMEILLEDMEPSKEQVFDDLVAEMRQSLVVPVLIGSAEHENGVLRLLKALRHEGLAISATVERLGCPDVDGASVVQVMKTIHTSHGGKLSISRVLKGSVKDGDVFFTADGEEIGRVSGLFHVQGQKTIKDDKAVQGQVIALGKLDNAHTGMTLTTAKAGIEPLEQFEPPAPVYAMAVSPKEHRDEVKLHATLQKLAEEDPSLIIEQNQDSGETILKGQGEMHLRVALERLEGKYSINIEHHAPTVPYKETIRKGTSVRGRHKKQSGGHGQFGDVVLDIKPVGRGEGFVFTETITGGVVPKNYFGSVENGIKDALVKGPLGFKVVDVTVNLSDGSYHAVDSSDQAFRAAGALAMREGLPQCSPVLLEPIMNVKIAVPNDVTAKVNTIVAGRRGQLMGYDARPGWEGWDVVESLMPQSEIVDLIIELRSISAGVASYEATFDHMQELTGRQADMVMEAAAAAAE
ncbi:translation elongation factor 2 (EF-2/EF-G) [Cohaesibacter sp. ES.047]|uniref:elongation factor G n=1 Tax=Cohaesibacter sp. ES.047 TaxID=1798205 RepID=UPI000BB8998E|nr:elongation factor G [Cohaesibacter sp. ES.047]SNY91536.1 translation elongation factor 2 (EF-2/EF-G) [Cohaesibacter sp. ES.047]